MNAHHTSSSAPVCRACRERVKELTCLYDLLRLADRVDITQEELLQGVADLLPPAWQFPEVAYGAVELDGRRFVSPGPWPEGEAQSARIVVEGRQRGRVEVCYADERPRSWEGPFLREERHLIDALAREVGGIIERRDARAEHDRLREQLRHADRLATLGQLSAGVAHELNEPLANILGYAELSLSSPGLSSQLSADLGKIVSASLHAREIVGKLRLFARQSPPRRELSDVNALVRRGSFLIEARCAKQGVEIVHDLDPRLPEIVVDPGGLHQVLVNLTLNAVQAMPEGGRLTLRTRRSPAGVQLEVEDEGSGVPPELKDRIFLPFFTTKSVEQGTGLGLSVVHGIVSAHGGSIEVESEVGRGTVFTLLLPAGAVPAKRER